ncbi:hypothetical protein DM02DRAFT_527606 [Periconia macrospinosa]|uniref:Uncharacterized protein n=1 Tax=Periconia macrospinosa TaxID=97972 RepID=A0A2V1DQL1_9PLEO|nr:hypothetical protein DM02DRAFT_527606 [Periconia macrospinosa]
MHHLEEMRRENTRPSEISRRTPRTMSNKLNAADNIERHLRADGHRLWGFVVYRCTYTDDLAWNECIRRIQGSVHESMDLCNGHDLLQKGCFELTVIADAGKLEGASTSFVRRHFQTWCEHALTEEQGTREETERRSQISSPWDSGSPVRYEFCVQVDEDSMRSINREDDKLGAWVRLIRRNWDPDAARLLRERDRESRVDDEELDDDIDDMDEEEEYPAVEGCTEEDVGWMKMQLVGLIPELYANLRNPDSWHTYYLRPPHVSTV